MPKSNALVGRWVIIPVGENALPGQITAAVADHLIIKVQSRNGVPQFSQLVTLDDLSADKGVLLFDDETQIAAWQAWQPDDDGLRVVPLRKKWSWRKP